MSALSPNNSSVGEPESDWEGFYFYTPDMFKKELDAQNSNTASTTSASTKTSTLFLSKPIVIIDTTEPISSDPETDLSKLGGKKILAVNAGFIYYLFGAENISALPTDVKANLFFSEGTDLQKRNPIAAFFVPFIHAMNFLISITYKTTTPLLNFSRLFNYIVSSIGEEREGGRGATLYGKSLTGSDSIYNFLPIDSNDDISLFTLLDMIERGPCAVFEYLKYYLMPSPTGKKLRSVDDFLKLQEEMGEGIGSRPITNSYIKYFGSRELIRYSEQVQKIVKEFNSIFIPLEEGGGQITPGILAPLTQKLLEAKEIVKASDAVKPPKPTGTGKENAKQIALTDEENRILKTRIREIVEDMIEQYNVLFAKIPKGAGGVSGPAGGVSGPAKPREKIPTTIDDINNWVLGQVGGLDSDQTRVEGVLSETEFPNFGGYQIVSTPGYGNCLISAFLTAVSSAYRSVETPKLKDEISVRFRELIKGLKTKDGADLFTATELTNLCGNQFIMDSVGKKLADYYGLNFVLLVSYIDEKGQKYTPPSGEGIRPSIGSHENTIILYLSGAKVKDVGEGKFEEKLDSGAHYSAVKSPAGDFFVPQTTVEGLIPQTEDPEELMASMRADFGLVETSFTSAGTNGSAIQNAIETARKTLADFLEKQDRLNGNPRTTQAQKVTVEGWIAAIQDLISKNEKLPAGGAAGNAANAGKPVANENATARETLEAGVVVYEAGVKALKTRLEDAHKGYEAIVDKKPADYEAFLKTISDIKLDFRKLVQDKDGVVREYTKGGRVLGEDLLARLNDSNTFGNVLDRYESDVRTNKDAANAMRAANEAAAAAKKAEEEAAAAKAANNARKAQEARAAEEAAAAKAANNARKAEEARAAEEAAAAKAANNARKAQEARAAEEAAAAAKKAAEEAVGFGGKGSNNAKVGPPLPTSPPTLPSSPADALEGFKKTQWKDLPGNEKISTFVKLLTDFYNELGTERNTKLVGVGTNKKSVQDSIEKIRKTLYDLSSTLNSLRASTITVDRDVRINSAIEDAIKTFESLKQQWATIKTQKKHVFKTPRRKRRTTRKTRRNK